MSAGGTDPTPQPQLQSPGAPRERRRAAAGNRRDHRPHQRALSRRAADDARGIGTRLVTLPEQATRGDQTDARRARGRCRIPAGGRGRERVDVASRARGQPPTGTGRTRGARRDEVRLLSLAIAESLVLTADGRPRGPCRRRAGPSADCCRFRGGAAAGTSIDVDAPVALFAAGSPLCSADFGGVVAAHRSGGGLAAGLRASSRSSTPASSTRTRAVLVVAQVALAVVLLSAAGLMLASVVRLSRVSPGLRGGSPADLQGRARAGSNYTPRGRRGVRDGSAPASAGRSRV